MHERGLSSYRPWSVEPLRQYLRTVCDERVLWRVAAANYGSYAEENLVSFRRSLETGEEDWSSPGNTYECCLLCLHLWPENEPGYDARVHPAATLFSAWWLVAFCTRPELWTLMENLGVQWVLRALVEASARLGTGAGHAAAPLVGWFRRRDPRAAEQAEMYVAAERALDAVEKLGTGAVTAGRYVAFMKMTDRGY